MKFFNEYCGLIQEINIELPENLNCVELDQQFDFLEKIILSLETLWKKKVAFLKQLSRRGRGIF
jgi:hypothetical protein